MNKGLEALEILVKAAEINKNHPNTWCCFGHALKINGHVSDAAEAYKKALSFAPNYDEAHYHLGECNQLLGDWNEAKNELFWFKSGWV